MAIVHALGSAERCVVKILDKSMIARRQRDPDEHLAEDPMREMKMMKYLETVCGGHKGIMTLKAVFESDEYYFMVMPYLGDDCEELFSAVTRDDCASESAACLSRDDAIIVCQQLLDVVAFLHKHHIAHADISCENVLIMGHGRGTAAAPAATAPPGGECVDSVDSPDALSVTGVRICLIDFGLAVATDSDGRSAEFLGRRPTR